LSLKPIPNGKEVVTLLSFFRTVALVVEVAKVILELLKILNKRKDKPLT